METSQGFLVVPMQRNGCPHRMKKHHSYSQYSGNCMQVQRKTVTNLTHQSRTSGVKYESQPEKRMMPPFKYAIVSFSPDPYGVENQG